MITKLPLINNIDYDREGNAMGIMRNAIRDGNFLKKIKFSLCF